MPRRHPHRVGVGRKSLFGRVQCALQENAGVGDVLDAGLDFAAGELEHLASQSVKLASYFADEVDDPSPEEALDDDLLGPGPDLVKRQDRKVTPGHVDRGLLAILEVGDQLAGFRVEHVQQFGWR